MELNSSELNGGELNSPPPSGALPSGESHMRLNLSCDLTFSTEVKEHKAGINYHYFAPEIVYSEGLVLNYGYYKATILQKPWISIACGYYVPTEYLGNRLALFYDLYAPNIRFARSLLHITTDFTPYDVVIGYPVSFAYTMNGVRTQYLGTFLAFSTYVGRYFEVDFKFDLACNVGIPKQDIHKFTLQSWLYDFDPMPFQFSCDMGMNILVENDNYIAFRSDMGVLSQTVANSAISLAYTVGRLTDFFGSSLSFLCSLPIVEVKEGSFNLNSWIRNEDHQVLGLAHTMDFGSADLKLTLSSAKYNTVEHIFSLQTDITYSSGLAMFSLSCDVERHIRAGFVIPCTYIIAKKFTLVAGIRSSVRRGVYIAASLLDRVHSGVLLAASMGYVRNGVDISAPLRKVAKYGVLLDLPFAMYSRAGLVLPLIMRSYARRGVVVSAALLSTTAVKRRLYIASPLTDTSPHIRISNLYITLGGKHIELIRSSVRADEDDYAWHGTFVLANPRELALFTINAEFSVNIYGDVYQFLVETKSNKRTSPTTIEATVLGISPSSRLDEPRALAVTKNWESATTAKTIVEEVAGGYPMLWEILDWAIPGNRYGVAEIAPVRIIQEIAKAVGGTVDTLPDGTLRVRYKYPVSVPNYGPLVAEATYVEADDIFECTEEFAPAREYDKFRITDADNNVENDTLEYEELTADTGYIRVYPGPWRETFILKSTAIVYIGPRIYEVREEKEVVEITKGEGSTRYPVYSVASLEWMDDDLLGIVAGADSRKVTTTHPTKNYSLAKIVYNTRCFKYFVRGTLGRHAQFIVENP